MALLRNNLFLEGRRPIAIPRVNAPIIRSILDDDSSDTYLSCLSLKFHVTSLFGNARVEFSGVYQNTTDELLDGLLVFPLLKSANVSQLLIQFDKISIQASVVPWGVASSLGTNKSPRLCSEDSATDMEHLCVLVPQIPSLQTVNVRIAYAAKMSFWHQTYVLVLPTFPPKNALPTPRTLNDVLSISCVLETGFPENGIQLSANSRTNMTSRWGTTSVELSYPPQHTATTSRSLHPVPLQPDECDPVGGGNPGFVISYRILPSSVSGSSEKVQQDTLALSALSIPPSCHDDTGDLRSTPHQNRGGRSDHIKSKHGEFGQFVVYAAASVGPKLVSPKSHHSQQSPGDPPTDSVSHLDSQTAPGNTEAIVLKPNLGADTPVPSADVGCDPSTLTWATSTGICTILPRRARALVFLIDRSAMMGVESLAKLKRGLIRVLRSLPSRDSFSLVAYNHGVTPFSSQVVPAQPHVIKSAVRWLNALTPCGHNNLHEPIICALDMLAGVQDSVPTVVFTACGSADNERYIAKYVTEHAAAAHMLTLGIGPFCNMDFLSLMASVSGGVSDLVLSVDDITSAFEHLMDQSAGPLLTKVTVQLKGPEEPAAYPSLGPYDLMDLSLIDYVPSGGLISASVQPAVQSHPHPLNNSVQSSPRTSPLSRSAPGTPGGPAHNHSPSDAAADTRHTTASLPTSPRPSRSSSSSALMERIFGYRHGQSHRPIASREATPLQDDRVSVQDIGLGRPLVVSGMYSGVAPTHVVLRGVSHGRDVKLNIPVRIISHADNEVDRDDGDNVAVHSDAERQSHLQEGRGNVGLSASAMEWGMTHAYAWPAIDRLTAQAWMLHSAHIGCLVSMVGAYCKMVSPHTALVARVFSSSSSGAPVCRGESIVAVGRSQLGVEKTQPRISVASVMDQLSVARTPSLQIGPSISSLLSPSPSSSPAASGTAVTRPESEELSTGPAAGGTQPQPSRPKASFQDTVPSWDEHNMLLQYELTQQTARSLNLKSLVKPPLLPAIQHTASHRGGMQTLSPNAGAYMAAILSGASIGCFVEEFPELISSDALAAADIAAVEHVAMTGLWCSMSQETHEDLAQCQEWCNPFLV